ncbi:MAG: ArgR family transcriptional regulator [Elusimicrobia bacterium]|nr:ArgR family transcriptional regulator [Elusimicrobiota bacterium]
MNKYSERGGKAARQAAILEAVAHDEVATQNDLVRALKKRGIEATQVSISRDVAELGLVKAGGLYKAATAESGAHDPELPLRTFVRKVVPAGPNLTVVRCDTGTAPRVGLVLDGLTLPGLAGTLAGDDTVFVATESAAAQKKLVEFLETRMNNQ